MCSIFSIKQLRKGFSRIVLCEQENNIGEKLPVIMLYVHLHLSLMWVH